MAYGIVAGGTLVHTAGYGQRWLGGPAPDAGTVFRIASMTKSFTAAAVLALRDDGALRLDDPVAYLVPELRGMRQVSADSPDITVRHLLTMTAGFPTDDPWGDRQQGLPLADFATLLNRGVRQAWAPGTCFEYSNLGYALLGRVVAAAAGSRYQEFVASRLLGPLGLDRTGYELAGFEPAEVARGYQRGADGWAELAPDGDGAFAPMGGVFSCVRDLAGWVTGLAAGFPAGAEADGGPHPLRRASRREMQLPQIALPPATALPLAGLGSQLSYGFGLFIEEHPAWGRLVFHGGGYPGFGSHMRWHPASGLAVIVLANSTYAAAHPLAGKLLDALLRAAPAPPAGQPRTRGPVPAPGAPWPETIAAQPRGGRAAPVLGRPGRGPDLHAERGPGRAVRRPPGQGRADLAAARPAGRRRGPARPNPTPRPSCAGGCTANAATRRRRSGSPRRTRRGSSPSPWPSRRPGMARSGSAPRQSFLC